MKVLILVGGSRGDLQPLVALAYALNSAGHETILAGPTTLTSLATPYGVRYEGFYDVTVDAYKEPLAKLAFKIGGNSTILFTLQQLTANRRHMSKALEDIAGINLQGVDVVLFNHMCPGNEIAEKLGVPSIPVGTCPIFAPTDSFFNPWLRFSRISIPKMLNRPSYLLTNAMVRYNLGDTSKWRKEILGLPPRRGHRNMLRLPDGRRPPLLQPFSLTFLPMSTNYPDWVHTTGYWFLPRPPGWVPDLALVEFIESSDPPVYVGFGSVTKIAGTAERAAQVVVDAAQETGVRIVVAGDESKGNSTASEGRIFYLNDPVPFDWLFPRMAAVVHHGGTGTLASALRASRPQVICPAIFEQWFNAERAHEINVAPAPLPLKDLSAQHLARAIDNCLRDKDILRASNEIGERVRQEDGIGAAISLLESLV